MTKEEYEKRTTANQRLWESGNGDYERYCESQMELKDAYIKYLEDRIEELSQGK